MLEHKLRFAIYNQNSVSAGRYAASTDDIDMYVDDHGQCSDDWFVVDGTVQDLLRMAADMIESAFSGKSPAGNDLYDLEVARTIVTEVHENL